MEQMDLSAFWNGCNIPYEDGHLNIFYLEIDFHYKIVGSKYKETRLGLALTLELEDINGNLLYIYMPKRIRDIFIPYDDPYEKLKMEQISHVKYRGMDRSRSNRAVLEFMSLEQ